MKTTGSNREFRMKKEYDFSQGLRGRFYKPRKIQRTFRIDDDTLLYFKRLAILKKTGYQTLINAALRKVMNSNLDLED